MSGPRHDPAGPAPGPSGDSYLAGTTPAEAAPRSPYAARPEEQRETPGGGRPPRLVELAPVLLLVLALQLLALSWVEGYQLADSVEYLDRAEQVARGQPLDPGTVRSFAFSAVFVPVFWVARLLGGEASVLPVALARLLVMALGLAAVVVTARIGWLLGGRRAGLTAAFLAGVNPVFLQYSVEPLSGAAAMLCVALGTERLLRRGGWRRGLGAGTWLGLGVLVAFKVILVAGVLLVLVFLRERWRGRRLWLGAGIALAAMLLVQCLLDLAVYGAFGTSLMAYLGSNLLTQAGTFLYRWGFEDLGKWLYDRAGVAVDETARVTGGLRSKTSPLWYLQNLRSAFLVAPALLFFVAGVVRALGRPRWTSAIALGAVVLSVTAMSVKGDKSFRLWLPLLPLIAAVGGAGYVALVGRPVRGGARTLIGAGLLLLTAWLGLGVLRATNLVKYGGYWEAVGRVETAAAAAGRVVQCGSAYHWAVQYRASENVQLVKLPHHLDRWDHLDDAARQEVIAAIGTYDWLIGHQQAFTQDPALIAAVNARFEIHSAIYRAATFEELQPIYVLRKRSGAPGARTFFDVLEGAVPHEVQAALQVPRSVDLRRALPDTGEVDHVVLLGWSVESESEGELAWLTTAWYAGPIGPRDYTITYRITDKQNHPLIQLNHVPGFGALPTSSWAQGTIVRETLLLSVPLETHRGAFGGDYYRGDLVPCELWLAAPEWRDRIDPETGAVMVHPETGLPLREVAGGLNVFHPSGGRPIHKQKSTESGRIESLDGRRFSNDGLYLAGGFFLPVPARGRLPDDGRPLREPPGTPGGPP